MTESICECGHPRNEHTDTGGCDELSIGGCDECVCPIFKQATDRPHINKNGEWQSDKVDCPPDYLPLSFTDPLARELIAIYAMRKQYKDSVFTSDVFFRLGNTLPKGSTNDR